MKAKRIDVGLNEFQIEPEDGLPIDGIAVNWDKKTRMLYIGFWRKTDKDFAPDSAGLDIDIKAFIKTQRNRE